MKILKESYSPTLIVCVTRIQGTGREGGLSVQMQDAWIMLYMWKWPKVFQRCHFHVCSTCGGHMHRTCVFSPVYSRLPSPRTLPPSQLFWGKLSHLSTPFSPQALENNPTLPPPSPQGPTAAFERFVWNLLASNTFYFLPKSYLNGLCPSDESLLETWQEPLESRQTGSVNQTKGKNGQREDLGVKNEVTGPHINPSWLTRCPSKMGEIFFNFASLTPHYFTEITPDTIIKLRSWWIVHNDNSTFVIQLQINPLCSVLLHRFWYHSSILTVAYYCHTKMLPEP